MASMSGSIPSTRFGMPILREGGGRWEMVFVYLALHLSILPLLWTGLTWTEGLWCFVLLQVRGLGMSAGYHRLLAHSSFRTTRWFRFVLAFLGCTALRGGPLWWTALHRRHHPIADTEEDIFTPAKGFWWSYIGWLISGRYDTTDYSRVRDLARAPELVWLNRNWLLPPLALALLCFGLGGWRGLVAVFCLSSVILFHSMAWLDVLSHWVGRRRYDTGDDSRNNLLLSLLAQGEGWHNNHHHYPASARQGFYWYEIDATYDMLRLLRMFGLVWDLKVPPDVILKSRLLKDRPGRHEQHERHEQASPAPALELDRLEVER
jgi:stearoyl-CoA desaturase (delta-9 desaturase)